MRQSLVPAIAAAFMLTAAASATASPPVSQLTLKGGQSKFISQQDVEASGGYRLAVPGRGVFKVVRVGSPRDPAKKCLVETASLQRLIAARPETGNPTAAGITIQLRAYTGGTCPSDTICCSGSGSGCSVEVVIVQKPSGGGN
jgi:hypothetical protein